MIAEITGIALIGGLFAQVNKSVELEGEASKKNIRAFTKMAEAQNKLERCQQEAIDKLIICARRKEGILNAHIKMFSESFEKIRKIEFCHGQGIEEIEKFKDLSQKMDKLESVPALATQTARSDTQLLLSLALYGIGGLMIKDSEKTLKLASRNMAQANAVSAQIDSMCIALNGLVEHAEIVTELLQKLGLVYIKAIKNMEQMINEKGMNPDNYSAADIDSINGTIALTKIIYRIINTPLVDENSEISMESKQVIKEGIELLDNIKG